MDKEYFFKTDNLLIWRPSGILDYKKIVDFINFVDEQSEKKDSHFLRFIDLSRISDVSAEYEELYDIASKRKQQAKKKFNFKVKMGFYVTNTLSFGMARMYENLLDSHQYDISINYSLEEVSEFLQIDISLLKE